jgi:outer membrane protein
LAALAIAAFLAAGCVNQDQEVERYRSVLDSTPLNVTGDEKGPLTLTRAMFVANKNNETLGLAGEDYIQSLIAKDRAVSAFLPTVSFQPNFTIEQKPGPNASSGPGPFGTGLSSDVGSQIKPMNPPAGAGFRVNGNTLTRFEAPLVGSINLFNGFGDVANVKVSESTIEMRKLLLLDAQQSLLLNVAQVFYQVLKSEQQTSELKNSLQVQQARVAYQRDSFKNGLATALSVSQSEAQAAATAAQLAQAQGDIQTGRSTLAFIVGIGSIQQQLADDLQVPDKRPPESEFAQRALSQRQDIQAAVAQREAARHSVDVAISEYYPSVSLNVAGFLSRESFTDASKWDAILTANIPIFSAGLIDADVRAAWSRLRQAALTEWQTRRKAIEDVETSYQNLLTTERRIVDLREEVRAADESLKQSQSQYANGLAILLDVLTAQDQLLSAQLQLTSAQFDRSVFYLSLLRASGELQNGFVPEASSQVPASQPASSRPAASQPAAR